MVMRTKTAWNKNKRREVWKTMGRFLSILSIVALGVGFFSGLKVTKNAMIDTADAYLREYAMYDEKVMTTIGIDEADVAKIASMDGISAAEGSVSMDVLATLDTGESYVVAAHSITSDSRSIRSASTARRRYALSEAPAATSAIGRMWQATRRTTASAKPPRFQSRSMKRRICLSPRRSCP